MGLKKLIKSVQKILNSEAEREQVTPERIDELLGELEHKEKKLHHKLSEEKHSKKRKDLKLQLKIISTQRKKALALLHELKKKSH
jgi:hypothetical protein